MWYWLCLLISAWLTTSMLLACKTKEDLAGQHIDDTSVISADIFNPCCAGVFFLRKPKIHKTLSSLILNLSNCVLTQLLRFSINEDKDTYSQYHGYWWPGDARSQGIIKHATDLLHLEYSSPSTTRVNRENRIHTKCRWISNKTDFFISYR